jgi:secondary thiamine-phosphate synthase enzyme
MVKTCARRESGHGATNDAEFALEPRPQPRASLHFRPSVACLPRGYDRQRMTVYTDYLWFTTKKRREIVRITDEVAAIVKKSAVREGMVLVSAMHITAGVYVNDWESGLIDDIQEWVEQLAPARPDYRHHQTGEDNADAHLKRTLLGHQVMLPITSGALDLGPWEQVFYAEFDGQRRKRVIVKVMGQ